MNRSASQGIPVFSRASINSWLISNRREVQFNYAHCGTDLKAAESSNVQVAAGDSA
jgi:hypothetical protein